MYGVKEDVKGSISGEERSTRFSSLRVRSSYRSVDSLLDWLAVLSGSCLKNLLDLP